MLKSRETYEIMTPESIGLQRNPEDAGGHTHTHTHAHRRAHTRHEDTAPRAHIRLLYRSCSLPRTSDAAKEVYSMCVCVCMCARVAGIVLGKHSGRNALSSRLKSMGYDLAQEELDEVFK